MFDPLLATLIIAVFPLVGVSVLYYVLQRKKSKKKELFFLLGFMAVTTYYVLASAPEVIYRDYAQTGDYLPVILFGFLAMGALFVAVYFFRRHVE